MADEDPPVLTTREASRRLGISQRGILRIPVEDLPYVLTKGGGHRQQRRYRASDVDRYAATSTPLPPTLEERVSDLEQWRQSVEERLAGRDQ